ncbi:MAG: PH domain-containing protein [Nocardioidaceae bacterium]
MTAWPLSRGAEPSDASQPSQADQLIAQVSTAHLIRANLLDGVSAWLLLVAWFVALVVGTVVWGWEAVLAAFAFLVPVTIGVVAQTSRQIGSMMKDANFRLYRTQTGVRISSGLTSTINRTIDFDRIQSVRVMEPFLWRRFGWAGVLVDIAGGPLDAEKAAALMPVAGRAAALDLVTQVTGVSLDHGAYVGAGARARSVDPIAWRHLAVALFDEGAARRSGRWRRSTAFVPYKRVQSVTARQGWLQRRLALATVFVDLPVGAKRWDAQHRSVKDAAILVHELSHRASALAGLEPASQSAGGRADHETEEQASQQLASGVEHRP